MYPPLDGLLDVLVLIKARQGWDEWLEKALDWWAKNRYYTDLRLWREGVKMNDQQE